MYIPIPKTNPYLEVAFITCMACYICHWLQKNLVLQILLAKKFFVAKRRTNYILSHCAILMIQLMMALLLHPIFCLLYLAVLDITYFLTLKKVPEITQEQAKEILVDLIRIERKE